LLEYVRDALEDLQVLLVILGILFFIIIVIIQRRGPAPLRLHLLP
jgi:hypothetical protein